MSKEHKPLAGSRGFWPRKRAKRIYPRVKARHWTQASSWKQALPVSVGFASSGHADAVPMAFAAYKAGMVSYSAIDGRKGSPTQNQEVVRPATVLAAPPLAVVGVVAYDHTPEGPRKRTEIWAANIAKELRRARSVPAKPADPKTKLAELEKHPPASLRLLVHTKPRDATGKKTPEVFEVPLGGTIQQQLQFAQTKLGAELAAGDVFKEGELVDVRAVSTGKGFQGVVKRFGVVVRSRKSKGKMRHIGSLGPQNPARVLSGKIAMPGQLGFQTRTEQNKRILKIASGKMTPKGGFVGFGEVDGNYVLLAGSVPGPRKRLIVLQKGIRTHGKPEPVEIKNVFLESQQ